ncbi:MAG: 8-oxoguanine deaminase [Candidatus Neomarinimicrobiota bacterium]
MTRILIKNSLLTATMDDASLEYQGGHILVEDDKIVSLGPEDLDAAADETINAAGMLVLPGFINTHHHLYQTLTKNIPGMQNQPLFKWLKNHYEVWRELRTEAIYISARTGLLELMKSGTTCSSDHLYLFPEKAGPNLIDEEIKAAKELGIRFHPARGSMSLGQSKGGLPPDDTVQDEAEIMLDAKRLLEKYHEEGEGAMVRLSLAPCSPFSVTPELMKTTAEFAKENGLQLHTHLAETLDEEKFCMDKFGKRPLEYADSLGWLNNRTWFAHAIHLDTREIQKLGEHETGVSHCPTSNMRLGSGIARIKEMLEAGVPVSLGVDGSASNDSGNMLMEIRNAMLISRLRNTEHWLSARDVLRLATRGGAAVMRRGDIGQLAVGRQADIALFSMNGLEYAGALSDPLAALVFSVRLSPVDFLMIKGRLQIRNGLSLINEADLINKHNLLSASLLKQAEKNSRMIY